MIMTEEEKQQIQHLLKEKYNWSLRKEGHLRDIPYSRKEHKAFLQECWEFDLNNFVAYCKEHGVNIDIEKYKHIQIFNDI